MNHRKMKVDGLSSASKSPLKNESHHPFADNQTDELELTEDLTASGRIETSLDIDKNDPNWLEKASQLSQAVDTNTYVKLDCGLMTVNQINYLLKSMPFELTFVDSNNQFLYYNRKNDSENMLVARELSEIGSPLAGSHPEKVQAYVGRLVQQLRQGKEDSIAIPVPSSNSDQFIVHYYRAIRDDQQNYMGINQQVLDIKEIIDYYLEQTQQKLVPKE